MNEPNNGTYRPEAGGTETERDRFFEERPFQPLHPPGPMPGVNQPPVFLDPYAELPKKSKFAAGILAFFIPGTGHFYLGLMQRGLFIMLLFILNIAAIPYTMNHYNMDNSYIPFVVLLGCLIPVIYFYNLFDALQSTDQVNAYRRAVQLGHVPMIPGSDPLGRQSKGGTLGMALIAVGVFLFLVSTKPAWLDDLFDMMGSYVGAIILIGAGVLLFLNESKKR
ncbi:hypothetical protein [Gorillibacterium sp. sgz5001074]|uniref:hypothetical protein n=1 Tax=Gorillibacterium sp. sgz5001074 TaxID=3446695 RepID=UPI003F66BCCD